MLEFVHVLMQSLGWDPIFEYEGQTYAEMDKEAKVSAFFRPLCGICISGSTGMGMQTYPTKKKSESLTPFGLISFQNKISHRYKALVKLQQWLAEGQQ